MDRPLSADLRPRLPLHAASDGTRHAAIRCAQVAGCFALTYGASLNWQVVRWLTASLQYTYTKQYGRDAFSQDFGTTGNYAENRATLSLFATF